MVWAPFSRIVLGCEKINFGSSVSPSGLFLEPFFISFGSFFRYVGSFFVLGRTLGALGPNFFIAKTVWTTKAPQEADPEIYSHSLDPILRYFLEYFSIFGALFLSFVFCWVPGPIFHGFWFYFDTIFWYFVVLVGTSGFSDLWQPFYSKRRFLQVKEYQF